jgi:oligopeptide/dipeptide ABC transporter ATP-binding protein
MLHERPLHPYTLRLAGSVPDIEGPRDLAAGIPGRPPDLASPPSGCRFHTRCDRAMPACVESFPAARSFGGAHRVCCHAVSDDGRLRGPDELPVLPSALAIAAAEQAGRELVVPEADQELAVEAGQR